MPLKVRVEVAQSYLTLCDPMDYRILQARILEWVDFLSPRDLPNPGKTDKILMTVKAR